MGKSYRRLTVDIFEVQGLYQGIGWVVVDSKTTEREALQRLRARRRESPAVTFQMVSRREQKEPHPA